MHVALADEEIVHPPWGLGGAQSVHCKWLSMDMAKLNCNLSHEVEAQECLLQEHPCISPHACCFGRWGNCSPTMRTGRCTECTLQMTVYGHGKIELQPFAWSGSTGMLAARASVHKSPCMLLWQMRKLFTHHEDWAVHRVYTANDCIWTWQNWTANRCWGATSSME